MKNYIILLFLINSSFLFAQGNVVLELEEQIKYDLSEILLDHPSKIMKSGDLIFWVSEKNIKVFDKNNFVYQYNKTGRGPGEYESLTNVISKRDTLYIFDNELKKIMVFKVLLDRLEYLSEEIFKVQNSRYFTVDENGNYYFRHGHNPNVQLSAVSQFDSKGLKLNEFGKTPDLAALGRGLRGGGITRIEGEGVYYSYLGDPTLYKIEEDGSKISFQRDIPEYFTLSDRNEVKAIEQNLTELIFKAYEGTRIVDQFSHNTLLIRIIEDQGPRMEEPTQYYLEVWTPKKRLTSNISIPGKYAFSDGEFIYTLSGYESDILSNNGITKVFNKYKLVIGGR